MCPILIVSIEGQEVGKLALYPQALTKRGVGVEESADFTLWMPGIYGISFLEPLSGFRLSSNSKKLALSSPLPLVPPLLSWRHPGSLVESPLDGASFMLTRDSIRWAPGTLISPASPNSELMRQNRKQVLCFLKFFFYGGHKFLGGKYPW